MLIMVALLYTRPPYGAVVEGIREQRENAERRYLLGNAYENYICLQRRRKK